MAGWHHQGGRVGRNLELAPEYKLLRDPHVQWRASFRDLVPSPFRDLFSLSLTLTEGKKGPNKGREGGMRRLSLIPLLPFPLLLHR